MNCKTGLLAMTAMAGVLLAASATASEPKTIDKDTKLHVTPAVRALIEKEGKVAVNTPGSKVVCRVESVTGSRFKKPVCATREEIEAVREKDVRHLQETRSKIPGGG